jgi:hypothetical protein
MTAMHDDAEYEAIFRRYWRRWLVSKSIDFLIMFFVVVAYAVLMAVATGYGTAIRRDASAVPFAFLVMIGILFLLGRPWSFTAYLDGVIEKRKQEDVTIVRRYLARQSIIPSFRDLEAEMRRRVMSSRIQTPISRIPLTPGPSDSGSSGPGADTFRQSANQS